MIVRSYTGRSVPEALSKVRQDLGDDALIIETRAIREPGILGRRSGYEVVAAHDDQTAQRTTAARATAPAAAPTPGVAAGLAAGGRASGDPTAHQAANLARQAGKAQDER